MSDYLKVMSDETAYIRDIAYKLQGLSSAFYATGNTAMADKLGDISELLMSAQKNINDAVSIEVSDRLRDAQENSNNMLRACLAGVSFSDPESASELLDAIDPVQGVE